MTRYFIVLSLICFIAACRTSKPEKPAADLNTESRLAASLGVTHYKLGLSDLNQKNYSAALQAFQVAKPFILTSKDYSPLDRSTLYNAIGKCYFFLNQADSATHSFVMASTLDSRNHEAFNNLGYVKFTQRDYAAAMTLYRQSLSLRPNYQEAADNLALAEAFQSGKMTWEPDALFDNAENLDNPEEKIVMYRRIAALTGLADAKNNLGVALYKAKRFDEAFTIFSMLIQTEPNYAMAYNNLGYLYEERRALSQAIDLYKKATELRARFTLALENLSAAYFEAQDIVSSERYAQEILSFEPTNEMAKSQLARCAKKRIQRN
jgi:tetratricopeptide (TPR) repeat protein